MADESQDGGYGSDVIQTECKLHQTRKLDRSESYEGAGGRESLHGIRYQRSLLMHIALRSMNKLNNFKLATEMKNANKFDDAILIYPKADGTGEVYRLIQAKHRQVKQKGTKKINAASLVKETQGPFSIPMYFQSFLKIVGNCTFLKDGDKIFDLIICSNSDFGYGSRFEDFILANNIFDVLDEEDFIFGKSLRKFKKEFPGKKKIVSLLMNCFSEFPQRFAKSISENEPYQHTEQMNSKKNSLHLERLYKFVFLDEVVDLDAKTFKEKFVVGVNLTGIGKHFRYSLFSRWEALGKEKTFEDWLNSKAVEVKGITEDHPMNVKSVVNKICKAVRRNLSTKVIKINEEKSLLYRNIEILKLMDVLDQTDRRLHFSERFLQSDDLCKTAKQIRTELIKNPSSSQTNLKNLEGITFELKENLIQSKNLTIRELNPEKYVEQFLSLLVFAVGQPNEQELEDMIKNEIKLLLYCGDLDSQYSKFYRRIDEWMCSQKGKFWRKADLQKFFDDIKEEVIFNLRAPISNFTGRVVELKKLHDILFQSESKTAVISQTASITGIGGIGKSELASMFAKIHSNKFNNILWIDCEELATSFRRLAFDRLSILRKNTNGEEKSIESIVEEVHQRFRGKKTLFVFDNAEQLRNVEEGSPGIQKYMAPSSEGKGNYYLITSQNQHWGNIKVLSLDKFTDEEAIEFFKVSLGDLDSNSAEDYEKLAEILGNFPLAMQHAVAYIKETCNVFDRNCIIADYLKKFREKSKELLEHEFSNDCDDHYTRTTYTTMELALESILSKGHGSLSMQIMIYISYLFPERIQLQILSNFFKEEKEYTLSLVLLLLHKYSLISLQGEVISVHRLLQRVIRIQLQETGAEEGTLKSILQSRNSLNIYHQMTLWGHIEPYPELVKEFSVLSMTITLELFKSYELESAITFCKKLEVMFSRCFGYCHIETIAVRIKRALINLLVRDSIVRKLYYEQRHGNDRCVVKPSSYKETDRSHLDETFDSLSTSYEELKKSYGDSHPASNSVQKLLKVLHTGTVYDLAKGVFDISSWYLDESDVRNDLIGVTNLLHLREYRGATKLLQDIKLPENGVACTELKKRVEVIASVIKLQFNEDFKGNYKVLEEKINELLAEGDLNPLMFVQSVFSGMDLSLCAEIVINTFLQNYETFRRTYGKEEQYVAEWRAMCGRALSSVGFSDEGLNKLLEVYVIQSRLTKESSAKTAKTRNWIAFTYCDKGDHREALRFHKQNLANNGSFLDTRLLGDADSKTAIAIEHYHLGEDELAMKITNELLKENGPVTFNESSFRRLLACLEIQTNADSLIPIKEFSQLHQQVNNWFGERSFSSLEVGLKYCLALYDSGNRKDSMELLNRTRCHLEDSGIRGESLPEVPLIELTALAFNRFKMIKVEKCYLLNILRTLKNYLGYNIPRTLLLMCKLALVECNLGNVVNALELLRDIERNVLPVKIGEISYTGVQIYVAQIHAKLKDFNKSLEILKEVQKIQDMSGNLRQQDIDNVMRRTAIAMGENGYFEESLNILRDLESSVVSRTGRGRREHLKSLRGIVIVLKAKGDIEDAITICKDVLLKQGNEFGEEDVDTLKTKVVLADLYELIGRWSEALISLITCHSLMRDKYGDEDYDTLRVKFRIGRIFYIVGSLKEGKKCLSEVYEKQENLLGKYNEETLATKELLSKFSRLQHVPKESV